ncbi:MAG TPA: hypothetical protein VGM93_14335, partial [Acidimicrobiales bacterium]
MTHTTEPPPAPPVPPGRRPSRTERVVAQRGIPVDEGPAEPVSHGGLRLLAMAAVLAYVGYRWPWVLVVCFGLVAMIFLPMTHTTEPPLDPPLPPGHRPSRADRVVASRDVPHDPAADAPVPYAWVRIVAMLGALAFVGYRWPWVLVVILGLVTMIFLHELGHFVMAKRAGMK